MMMTRTLPVLVALSIASIASAQESSTADLEKRIAEQERALKELKRDLNTLKKSPAGEGPTEFRFDPEAKTEFRFKPSQLPEEKPKERPDYKDHRDYVFLTEELKLGLFFIETRDGAHRLSIDGRFIPQYIASDRGQQDFFNTFSNRQIRLNFKGRLWKWITFHMALEFGEGADDPLRQGWFNFEIYDWLQLKAGQEKIPLTITFDEPFKYMNQPEWPMLVGNNSQSFELGAWLHGDLFGGALNYMVGVHNGNGPNNRFDNDDDTNVSLRLDLKPTKGLVLRGAIDYSPTNRQPATSFRDARTLGGFFTRFVDYNDANRRLEERRRGLIGLQYRRGPFELMSEFLIDHHRRVRAPNGNEMNLTIWSWYIEALYILTGETKGKTIVEVKSPLYTPKRGWGSGAWGVSFRFEDYDVENPAFTRGFATGTDKAYAVLGTVSWWPYQPLRFSATYAWTTFDDRVTDSTGDRHHDDHLFVLRAWLVF